jgi:hypothetical protein
MTTGPTSHPAGTSVWFPYVIVFVLVLGVVSGVVLLGFFLCRPLRVQHVKADQNLDEGRDLPVVELEELSEDAGVRLVE